MNTAMDKSTELEGEMQRLRYAFWLAVIGLGLSAALVVFLFYNGMNESKDIIAVVGVFTGVTGTLVGTFFGVQIGSAGRDQERAERKEADRMAQMAFGVMTEEQVHKAMDMVKDTSSTGTIA